MFEAFEFAIQVGLAAIQALPGVTQLMLTVTQLLSNSKILAPEIEMTNVQDFTNAASIIPPAQNNTQSYGSRNGVSYEQIYGVNEEMEARYSPPEPAQPTAPDNGIELDDIDLGMDMEQQSDNEIGLDDIDLEIGMDDKDPGPEVVNNNNYDPPLMPILNTEPKPEPEPAPEVKSEPKPEPVFDNPKNLNNVLPTQPHHKVERIADVQEEQVQERKTKVERIADEDEEQEQVQEQEQQQDFASASPHADVVREWDSGAESLIINHPDEPEQDYPELAQEEEQEQVQEINQEQQAHADVVRVYDSGAESLTINHTEEVEMEAPAVNDPAPEQPKVEAKAPEPEPPKQEHSAWYLKTMAALKGIEDDMAASKAAREQERAAWDKQQADRKEEKVFQAAASELGGINLDVPEIKIPKVDVPKVDAPEVEVPKVDVPKVEAPEVNAPESEPLKKIEPEQPKAEVNAEANVDVISTIRIAPATEAKSQTSGRVGLMNAPDKITNMVAAINKHFGTEDWHKEAGAGHDVEITNDKGASFSVKNDKMITQDSSEKNMEAMLVGFKAMYGDKQKPAINCPPELADKWQKVANDLKIPIELKGPVPAAEKAKINAPVTPTVAVEERRSLGMS